MPGEPCAAWATLQEDQAGKILAITARIHHLTNEHVHRAESAGISPIHRNGQRVITLEKVASQGAHHSNLATERYGGDPGVSLPGCIAAQPGVTG